MNPKSELFGVVLIAAASAAIIVPVEYWARRARPPGEVTRKLLHIAAILPFLFIPIVTNSTRVPLLPLLALTLAATAGLWAGARHGFLRSVSNVTRRSHGEAYYPIAIFCVFAFAEDRAWMFLSALLAFGVADAVAALIGARYGRMRYAVLDNTKSLEGSLIFFLITFFAVAIPLQVIAGLPWPNCVLAALLTATLTTGLEAVSLRGLDNLTVPVGVCIVLDQTVELSWRGLFLQNLILIGAIVGVGTVARLSRKSKPGTVIVFVLVTYAVSALIIATRQDLNPIPSWPDHE